MGNPQYYLHRRCVTEIYICTPYLSYYRLILNFDDELDMSNYFNHMHVSIRF